MGCFYVTRVRRLWTPLPALLQTSSTLASRTGRGATRVLPLVVYDSQLSYHNAPPFGSRGSLKKLSPPLRSHNTTDRRRSQAMGQHTPSSPIFLTIYAILMLFCARIRAARFPPAPPSASSQSAVPRCAFLHQTASSLARVCGTLTGSNLATIVHTGESNDWRPEGRNARKIGVTLAEPFMGPELSGS